ncbi:MAG: sugar ABC transporter permease, partial [Clostridia bacterium]|nr:sugar ABC transporter permease [Clostridia bacterium]
MVGSAPVINHKKKNLWLRIKKYWGFYLLFLPVLAFAIVFHYMPMFGVYFAFTKYNIIKDPVWVGLKNFERLFSMPNFWTAFTNTLELSIFRLLMQTGMAVIV